MNLTCEHNLDNDQLRKALAGMAIGSGIEHEMIETLQKAVCACDDKQPKEPRHPAMKELYRALQRELAKVAEDIEQDAAAISGLSQLMKAAGAPTQLTADQLRALQRAIQDRYGYLAAQLQSVDYQPPVDMLDRWKQLGLVHQSVTPETFAASVSSDMYFVRNAFILGRMADAVEGGKSFAEIMERALYMPLLKPDVAAIAAAERSAAQYITNNAADISDAIGQLWAKQQSAKVREMTVSYFTRELPRTVNDQHLKPESPTRYADNWQHFASELHAQMDDKARDWQRVAFTELNAAYTTGAAHRIIEQHGPDAKVYRMPMPTACPQCKLLYLLPDGRTPRIFSISTLLLNGDNVGRKAHPVRSGKAIANSRTDGIECLKAVATSTHPWCQCGGPYLYTGKEIWADNNSTKR